MTRADRVASAAWWPAEHRHRRTLAIVLLVAFALRVLWVLYAGREPTGFNSGDPVAYLRYGRDLAAGRGYRSIVTGQPTAFYPIGYPLFIAVFAWPVQHGLLPDDVTRIVGLAQAVLGTATVLFVWVIAHRLFGDRVALIAAGLTALWPGLILLTASLHLETVFVALLIGALAVLVGRPAGPLAPSSTRLLVAGVLLGLSALVRPFSLAVVGALFVAVLVDRQGVRAALRSTALVALPVVLVLAPWIARNQREMGTLALSTNMGDTFCLDHHVGATGRFLPFPPECFDGFDGVPPAEIEQTRNRENTRRALTFIREHPGTEAKLIVKRAWYMIDGDHDGLLGVESGTANPFLPDALRTTLRVVADWWYRIVLVLAAPGVVGFFRPGPARAERVIVVLTALALTAIVLELYGYTRFHVPLIPFQAMAAAVTLDAIARWRRPRSATQP